MVLHREIMVDTRFLILVKKKISSTPCWKQKCCPKILDCVSDHCLSVCSVSFGHCDVCRFTVTDYLFVIFCIFKRYIYIWSITVLLTKSNRPILSFSKAVNKNNHIYIYVFKTLKLGSSFMAIKLEMHLTNISMDFAKYFIIVYNSILMILFNLSVVKI